MSQDKAYEEMRERFAELCASMVKSSGAEVRRKEALREFDYFCRNRKVMQVVVQDRYFAFVTTRLVMDGNKGPRWAGAYVVRIDATSNGIVCFTEGHDDDYQHLHVGKTGVPCFGNTNGTVVSTLRGGGKLAALGLFMIQFLECYDSKSAWGASTDSWKQWPALSDDEIERWRAEERTSARHVSHVDPNWFNPRRADVLGLGAGGLTLALLLAKLGIEKIRGCDRDTVQLENLGPSLYGWEDVGEGEPVYKADAAARIIFRDTKIRIEPWCGDVLELSQFGDVVFLCLDSNDAKRELVKRFHAMGDTAPSRVFEARVSRSNMLVHSFDPRCREHVDQWLRFYLPDAEFTSEDRACGHVQVSLGSTAIIAAGLLEQMFIDFLRWDVAGREGSLVNQVFFELGTYKTTPTCWD